MIQGRVIPVTTHQVRLKMILRNRDLLEGEKEVYLSDQIDKGYDSIFLDPYPEANPGAISAIMEADYIVIGPGGLHTSIIPNLLVEGISKALRETKGKKIFICNLMNRRGQTTGYKVSDYVNEIVKYLREDVFDYILANNEKPDSELIERYAKEGELVENDLSDDRMIVAPLLGKISKEDRNDLLMTRSLIRHNSNQIAEEIYKIVNSL